MRLRDALGAVLASASFSVVAQLATPDPDWKEQDVPAPPAFDLSRLQPFDVSISSSLKFGVDPATIRIGTDGVLRYVVVARSASGAMNAMYEGIRCGTGEMRTYARFNPSGGWAPAANNEWRSLWSASPSRHTLMFAKQGGCVGNALPRSVDDVVRSLRNQDIEKTR